MIISINMEKAFEKIQYTFLSQKTLNKVETERNFFNLNKRLSKKNL